MISSGELREPVLQLATGNSQLATPMRWIWIDKFIAFDSGKSAVAEKHVTLAEEHLHDLYPDFPIVPHSLIIEGFAQTAGILVGEARNFAEKVILAKVTRATFHRLDLREHDVLLALHVHEQLGRELEDEPMHLGDLSVRGAMPGQDFVREKADGLQALARVGVVRIDDVALQIGEGLVIPAT